MEMDNLTETEHNSRKHYHLFWTGSAVRTIQVGESNVNKGDAHAGSGRRGSSVHPTVHYCEKMTSVCLQKSMLEQPFVWNSVLMVGHGWITSSLKGIKGFEHINSHWNSQFPFTKSKTLRVLEGAREFTQRKGALDWDLGFEPCYHMDTSFCTSTTGVILVTHNIAGSKQHCVAIPYHWAIRSLLLFAWQVSLFLCFWIWGQIQ